jgi:ABC-type multidrug transport system fused ATPase/permease subunit
MRYPAIPHVNSVIEAANEACERTDGERERFESLDHDITLDAVDFRYPGGKEPALYDVDLVIGWRKVVALVGSSGSGKSTIVDILAGLRQPTGGAVRIDGRDLCDINLSSWRKRIGYVTQDTTVFNDTVRNNLLFARPDARESDIATCLKAAHLTNVIEALPAGLDTVLGEGGVILSGGERQRLALARALIGKPELLLLDEATSALDNEAERIVQRAIEDISQEMTVLVVAHRLSTVRKADIIYVIEDGRIIETGTFTDLVEQGGRFAELHQLQFG